MWTSLTGAYGYGVNPLRCLVPLMPMPPPASERIIFFSRDKARLLRSPPLAPPLRRICSFFFLFFRSPGVALPDGGLSLCFCMGDALNFPRCLPLARFPFPFLLRRSYGLYGVPFMARLIFFQPLVAESFAAFPLNLLQRLSVGFLLPFLSLPSRSSCRRFPSILKDTTLAFSPWSHPFWAPTPSRSFFYLGPAIIIQSAAAWR